MFFVFRLGKSKESDSGSAYNDSFIVCECLLFKHILVLSVIDSPRDNKKTGHV